MLVDPLMSRKKLKNPQKPHYAKDVETTTKDMT
jgi:hypothetical protein